VKLVNIVIKQIVSLIDLQTKIGHFTLHYIDVFLFNEILKILSKISFKLHMQFYSVRCKSVQFCNLHAFRTFISTEVTQKCNY